MASEIFHHENYLLYRIQAQNNPKESIIYLRTSERPIETRVVALKRSYRIGQYFSIIVVVNNRFVVMTSVRPGTKSQYFEEKKKGEMNELKKYTFE